MKFTSIIKLIILFTIFYYIVLFINANGAIDAGDAPSVAFPWFGGDFTFAAPMWSIIGVSLAFGFIASALWMLGKTVISYLTPTGKLGRSIKRVEEKYYYGIEALSKSDFQTASVFFEEILSIDPDNIRTLVKYGELLRIMGKHQRAISLHTHAISLSENNVKVLHELALDYKAAGDISKAKEMLERIISISPKGNNSIYRELRDTLVEEGNWGRALEFQRKLIPLVQHSEKRADESQLLSGLEYELAMQRKKSGAIAEAITLLKGIIARDKEFLPAHLDLGQCYLDDESAEEAVKTWERGFKSTRAPILLVRLENYYLDIEAPDKAIEAYHNVLSQDNQDPLLKLLLGKLFYRLEMLDRAHSIFEEIDSEFEYAPVMLYFLGKIQARRGELEQAVETFRSVIRSSGVLEAEFICGNCRATFAAYAPRCSECGKWNTIALNVKKGQSISEMQVSSMPIYA